MNIEVLDDAKEDLIAGYHFYEEQSSGLGSYFLDSLFSDIDSLLLYAGIHRVVYGSHRCVAVAPTDASRVDFPLPFITALSPVSFACEPS